MSLANLEACVAAVREAIRAELGYALEEITDGRRMPSVKAPRHAHIRRDSSAESATLLSGARLREYVLSVRLRRHGGDLQEEAELDRLVQEDAERLHDLFHGKGLHTYPSLPGVEIVRAEVVDRDAEEEQQSAQEAEVRLSFPFFEEL